MSTAPDRRARKRLATRRAISDAATRLFFERGFDHVTVDEIAEAADVGRMTVFNYFPRKEDMIFDLDEEGREELLATLADRDPRVTPIEALRVFAHRVIAEEKPYVTFFRGSLRFIETVEASDSLMARARAIRDELAHLLTTALARSVGRDPDDSDAHLTAHFLVATWAVAFVQAHRAYRERHDVEEAKALFLSVIDKGTAGVNAMMAATPYASTTKNKKIKKASK